MKISYRTHPMLEKIANDSLGRIPIYESDGEFFNANMKTFVHLWKKYNPLFKKEIVHLSHAFYEDSEKAATKVAELYADIAYNSDYEVSKTFLYGDACIQLYQKLKQGSEDITLAFFAFEKDGKPLLLHIEDDECGQIMWCSAAYNKSKEDFQAFMFNKVGSTIMIDVFMKHAEVEVKYIASGKKINDITCKYVNDTKLNITYMDSMWFTTLVKSDEFNVRGHFRLQAYGEGLKERKIIWISQFKKTGYTAPARKLVND